MGLNFPSLPSYSLTWRGLYIEPIPDSGEKITIGVIAKGADGAFNAIPAASRSKLNVAFGKQISSQIIGTLDLCLSSAKRFYATRPLSSPWKPPLSGISVSSERELRADNIDDGVLMAANQASIFYLGVQIETSKAPIKSMSVRDWRKEIAHIVKVNRKELSDCFNKEVTWSTNFVHPVKPLSSVH